MQGEHESDWYKEPCRECVKDQFDQLLLERLGKKEDELEAEGKKLSNSLRSSLWKEAEDRCVQLHEGDEDRYMVLHENRLEDAMRGMTDRTGTLVFPSAEASYVLCPFHRIRLWGVHSATLCTMMFSAIRIQKRVRHSDFSLLGIDKKTIDQCLKMAENRLERYEKRIDVDADMVSELERERARIEEAKSAIFDRGRAD